MSDSIHETEVFLVGAGPIGLETAIELKCRRIPYVHIDKGQVASTVYKWPVRTQVFSRTEHLGIGGIPVMTSFQGPCSREGYLAYLRSVVIYYDLQVNTEEELLEARKSGEFFYLTVQTRTGKKQYRARALVLATGGISYPRKLGIPGEDLDHVHNTFRDPHLYFRKRVLVVGGRNSALESAIRCFHAGAKVALSYRRAHLRMGFIKYWMRPEILSRIARKDVVGLFRTLPVRIEKDRVYLYDLHRQGEREVLVDYVLMMIGFEADTSILEQLGADLEGVERKPVFCKETMETSVPGLFVSGTVVAGEQRSHQYFIDNCHDHGKNIALAVEKRLLGATKELVVH